MSRKTPPRLDDPDDRRRHFTPLQRRLLLAGGTLLGLVLFIAYLFAPGWLYLLLVPAGMALYFRHDRRFTSERERVLHYLERIPIGERLTVEKFRSGLGIPAQALDAVVDEFPELCAPDRAGLVSADTMYNTVICWYYRQVKRREADEVRRLVAARVFRPNP